MLLSGRERAWLTLCCFTHCRIVSAPYHDLEGKKYEMVDGWLHVEMLKGRKKKKKRGMVYIAECRQQFGKTAG